MYLIKRYTIIAILLLPGLSTRAQWISRKPLSVARQEMPGVIQGRYIYVTGGISLLGITISDMEIYNIDTDKWSTGPTMPQPRHHHAMAVWGDKVYVIGGYKDVLFKPRSEMYIYDIPLGRWTTGNPLPKALGAGYAVAWNSKIYFFGGTDGDNASSAVYIYDIASDEWSTGADMPTPREHLAADVIEGRIYVVAGRGGDFSATRLEIYTPETDSWDAGTDLPTARSGIDAVAVKGKLYVYGGEGGGIHNEHEVYDPVTDTWETYPAMPNARHGLAVVASGDTIYTIAGATLEGYGPSKFNEAYILSRTTSIPSGYTNEDEITAYYNKTDGSLQMSLDSRKHYRAALSLFTPGGLRLFMTQQDISIGKNEWKYFLPGLPSGIYLMSLHTARQVNSIRFYIP